MSVALLVGAMPSPPDTAIGIGPLQLRAYGLAIAVGVVVWVAQRRWAARGGNPADISSLAIWSVIAGLVGARAYHVLTDYHRFQGRWLHALAVWEGGLGVPGGLLVGVIASVVTLAVLHHRQRREPPTPPVPDDEPHLTSS